MSKKREGHSVCGVGFGDHLKVASRSNPATRRRFTMSEKAISVLCAIYHRACSSLFVIFGQYTFVSGVSNRSVGSEIRFILAFCGKCGAWATLEGV